MEGSGYDRRLAEDLIAAGAGAGLSMIGFTSADVLEPARSVIPARKEAGLAGTMQFTYRNPERSTDPRRALPTATSVVVAARPYWREEPSHGFAFAGRVARYSWRDEYDELRAGLEVMADVLRGRGFEARVHLDDNHLVDRNLAVRAGLGWYGKNANVLTPEHGSWVVFGSVLTNAALAPATTSVADGCGPCRRCLDDCPTEAIIAPGVVDARRCLAWIVQGPGPIPREFRVAVGDRLYGCDECQDVCPPSRPTPVALRPADQHAQADEGGEDEAWVDLVWLLDADDHAILERLGRWYIADRDPNVIRRTAFVVLGNIGDADDPAVPRLVAAGLRHRSGLVRSHALWACRRLGLSDLEQLVADDDHPLVVEERGVVVPARA